MASEAQLIANQQNAQVSTGPRTFEGKTRTAGNAMKFGLFSAKNCVLPGDEEEYAELFTGLWNSLCPVGSVEEIFATEIIRNTWRLRRCASVEQHLGETAVWHYEKQERTLREQGKRMVFGVADPMCNQAEATTQAAVDRARVQATGGLSRAMSQLTRLQTERRANANTTSPKPEPAQPPASGASQPPAPEQPAPAPLPAPQVIAATPEDPGAKQTQLVARSASCPCGSGEKYKRCCGQNAPPLLSRAA